MEQGEGVTAQMCGYALEVSAQLQLPQKTRPGNSSPAVLLHICHENEGQNRAHDTAVVPGEALVLWGPWLPSWLSHPWL